jgi:hypothetical protein
MMLAAMLAMVLFAASPAMAHAVAVGGDFDGDGVFDEFDVDDDNDGIFDEDELVFLGDLDLDGVLDEFDVDDDNDGIFDEDEGAVAVAGDAGLQFQESDQTIAVAAQQINTGDAIAVSGDVGSASAASIEQELDVSVDATQNGFQSGGFDDDF